MQWGHSHPYPDCNDFQKISYVQPAAISRMYLPRSGGVKPSCKKLLEGFRSGGAAEDCVGVPRCSLALHVTLDSR
jgi:hypothetical protein